MSAGSGTSAKSVSPAPLLENPSSPPMRIANSRQIARPSPVPPWALVE